MATAASAIDATRTAAHRMRFSTNCSSSSSVISDRRDFHDHVGGLHDPDREVAGLEPSSSAASRVISDTTRWGPAWMCTTATRPSFSTLVTMPGNRLRADSVDVEFGLADGRGRLGEEPCQVGAVDEPLTAGATRIRSLPESAQRRTVSVLTPSRLGDLPHPVRRHGPGSYRFAPPRSEPER